VHDKHLFEYAVIRLVPSVDREEFLNIGVILYCQEEDFLQIGYDLNEGRLGAFSSRLSAAEIAEHLRSFEKISAGGDDAGPIGQLPIGQRFRWLTAPRSTIMQISSVHTGLCTDPADKLRELLTKLVK
jgi:hypothetical protein